MLCALSKPAKGLQHLLQVILCRVCTANAVHCCIYHCWCVYGFLQVSAFAAATAFDIKMDLQASVLSTDEAALEDHCASTAGMAPEPAASLLWPATFRDIERSARLLATGAAHCAPHTTCVCWIDFGPALPNIALRWMPQLTCSTSYKCYCMGEVSTSLRSISMRQSTLTSLAANPNIMDLGLTPQHVQHACTRTCTRYDIRCGGRLRHF